MSEFTNPTFAGQGGLPEAWTGGCGCWSCTSERVSKSAHPWSMPFVVCADCGNKRCPRATHHDRPCSGSNEPGQDGSRYAAAPTHAATAPTAEADQTDQEASA